MIRINKMIWKKDMLLLCCLASKMKQTQKRKKIISWHHLQTKQQHSCREQFGATARGFKPRYYLWCRNGLDTRRSIRWHRSQTKQKHSCRRRFGAIARWFDHLYSIWWVSVLVPNSSRNCWVNMSSASSMSLRQSSRFPFATERSWTVLTKQHSALPCWVLLTVIVTHLIQLSPSTIRFR